MARTLLRAQQQKLEGWQDHSACGAHHVPRLRTAHLSSRAAPLCPQLISDTQRLATEAANGGALRSAAASGAWGPRCRAWAWEGALGLGTPSTPHRSPFKTLLYPQTPDQHSLCGPCGRGDGMGYSHPP